MGISTTNNSGNNINLRYSNFLGMLYLSTPESEAHIKAVKAHEEIGEDVVKRGFTGARGDGPSAKALAMLKERGVTPVKVSGALMTVRAVERGSDDRKATYLSVCLGDSDGRYWLSVDLGSPGAQMLARKLYLAKPGAETEINLFATYDKRPGAARAYANHAASVRQGGEEVQGVSPKDTLAPMVNSALSALEAAGVPRTDRETYNKRRNVVEMDYHLGLIREVEHKYKELYEAGHDQGFSGSKPSESPATGTASGAAASAGPDSSGDDFGDFPGDFGDQDIPF